MIIRDTTFFKEKKEFREKKVNLFRINAYLCRAFLENRDTNHIRKDALTSNDRGKLYTHHH
jgi:hypothetical protein